MTMLISPISLVIPHYCCYCGEIGEILCQSCKHDIISEPSSQCLHCFGPTSGGNCGRCRVPYSHGWTVGSRREALAALVDASKFESVRAGCAVQAELLHSVLPRLPELSVIVPVPTIARHVRQRGYGHAEMIASHLARLRQVPDKRLIKRRAQHVQHGASRKQRQTQAATSFEVTESLLADTTYVIVDDVYTTGATIAAIAKELRSAGAGDVWAAVTSRQPLDEQR